MKEQEVFWWYLDVFRFHDGNIPAKEHLGLTGKHIEDTIEEAAKSLAESMAASLDDLVKATVDPNIEKEDNL